MSHRGPGVCPWLAYGAGSLAGGGVRAGDLAGVPSNLDAGAACKSSSAIGRGTKWSVAGEAVWQRGGGGLWSAAEGRPQAPWSSGRDRRCGRADGLTGLSRNGSLARSGYDVRGSVCCLALTSRRSLWRTCSDTVCASSRNGCLLDARNTSGGVHPGGGVEE